MGRHVFAIGGNAEASRFCRAAVGRIKIGVFVVSGLTAGLAAFMGASFYGSASSADATGYELYVIASAVVGGASLSGGKGSAVSAMLGAVLIVLIRQSIRTLHFDQNYEWIIIGCAIIIAVVLDQASARFAARRLATTAGHGPGRRCRRIEMTVEIVVGGRMRTLVGDVLAAAACARGRLRPGRRPPAATAKPGLKIALIAKARRTRCSSRRAPARRRRRRSCRRSTACRSRSSG